MDKIQQLAGGVGKGREIKTDNVFLKSGENGKEPLGRREYGFGAPAKRKLKALNI